MNKLQIFFYNIKEKRILDEFPNWKPIDYPFLRNHKHYLYTMYYNPKFGEGVWNLESIKELEIGIERK